MTVLERVAGRRMAAVFRASSANRGGKVGHCVGPEAEMVCGAPMSFHSPVDGAPTRNRAEMNQREAQLSGIKTQVKTLGKALWGEKDGRVLLFCPRFL